MTDFTASNGLCVRIQSGARTWLDIESQAVASNEQIQALREFFQHERDEELGRWRSTAIKHHVVYPANTDGKSVRVLNEKTSTSGFYYRGDNGQNTTEDMGISARAYFEAHPERKPWEDATYKDVWIWTTADNTQEALGWVAGDGTWDIITPNGDGIKAADRPVSALVEAGFEKFRGEVAGVKRIPEDAS